MYQPNKCERVAERRALTIAEWKFVLATEATGDMST